MTHLVLAIFFGLILNFVFFVGRAIWDLVGDDARGKATAALALVALFGLAWVLTK